MVGDKFTPKSSFLKDLDVLIERYDGKPIVKGEGVLIFALAGNVIKVTECVGNLSTKGFNELFIKCGVWRDVAFDKIKDTKEFKKVNADALAQANAMIKGLGLEKVLAKAFKGKVKGVKRG